MGLLSQKSYLGELTDRLYRLLELDGVVKADVEGTIQPVVIVGDGTNPGMGSQRGRRFSGFIDGAAPGNVAFFQATDEVIIDRVFLTVTGNAGAGTCNMQVAIGGGGGGTQVWPFLDRVASANDRPPVVTVGGGVLAATFAAIGISAGRWAIPAGAALVTQIAAITEPFFLAPGQTIFFSNTVASNIQGIVQGRTFG